MKKDDMAKLDVIIINFNICIGYLNIGQIGMGQILDNKSGYKTKHQQ